MEKESNREQNIETYLSHPAKYDDLKEQAAVQLNKWSKPVKDQPTWGKPEDLPSVDELLEKKNEQPKSE